MIEETDMELFNRVVEIYRKECEKAGVIPQIPSIVHSDISDKKYKVRLMMLRNSNSFQLCGFEYNTSTNKLKWVD